MADDDEEDCFLASEAFSESGADAAFSCVEDGVELMDYLDEHLAGRGIRELPKLILLDLNMPRKDGREALKEIKADPDLRSIPVVVLTTSKAEEDILRTYDLGVNSYITKPVSFASLVETIKVLGKYWFEIVELPTQ
jgi:CheY-like chemotaxis protein